MGVCKKYPTVLTIDPDSFNLNKAKSSLEHIFKNEFKLDNLKQDEKS